MLRTIAEESAEVGKEKNQGVFGLNRREEMDSINVLHESRVTEEEEVCAVFPALKLKVQNGEGGIFHPV